MKKKKKEVFPFNCRFWIAKHFLSSSPPAHTVDAPLVCFPIFYKKRISWSSTRQAAVCWLLLRKIISLAKAISLTWENCAVRWHWSRHFRGYYCKSKYIWKNRTINQNYQNLIGIQSLGYTRIQYLVRLRVVSVVLIKELWFTRRKTEDWTWQVPALSRNPSKNCCFFYLEAGRKSDGGRREAGFLKFFLYESAR